jgi:hypothetical protein
MSGQSCSRKYQKHETVSQKSSGTGCGGFLFGLLLASGAFVIIVLVFAH